MNKWLNITEQINLENEQIIWHCEQISYTNTSNLPWRTNASTLQKKYYSYKHTWTKQVTIK